MEHGRIAYVYHKIEALARAHGIALRAGDAADVEMLRRVCGLMADQLAQALSRRPPDGQHAGLYTNGGKPLPEAARAQAVTYSGGVADCIYTPPEGDVFRYGDVGVLLGQAIRENADLGGLRLFRPAETIRATVVGAGTHTDRGQRQHHPLCAGTPAGQKCTRAPCIRGGRGRAGNAARRHPASNADVPAGGTDRTGRDRVQRQDLYQLRRHPKAGRGGNGRGGGEHRGRVPT